MNYLTITNEQFFQAYNDSSFIFHTKTNQNFDYLDVHAFYVGFKKHYPNYGIQYELTENNSNLFYIKSTVSNNEILLIQKQEVLKGLEALESSTDKNAWKDKKKLSTRLTELNNELSYGYRGVVVKPYVIDLDTGLRTPSLDFPLMDASMNSVINPDSRDVIDNLARAEVKCGGRFTGYGYRLFTREDIGKDLEEAPKVKAIKAIVERCELLNKSVPDNVHFGTSYSLLRTLALQLRDEVSKLPKDD